MRQAGPFCLSGMFSRSLHRNIPVMKMKRYRTDLCLILCGVMVWFLADAEAVRRSAAAALALCAQSVIPALFPFLAVSNLLLALGFGTLIAPLFSGLMTPLFGLPGSAASPLLLGFIGGYPIGAQTTAALYRRGDLTADEARRLLVFCNNSNPAFLISVLGSGVFGSLRTGVYLWLIHILSALLTGLLFRGKGRHRRSRKPPALSSQAVSFPAALVEAVRGAALSMLSVSALIVFFYVLARPFTAMEGPLGVCLVGFTELFSLTPLLSANRFSLVLASGCAGWGGLSVLFQTAAVLDGTDLPLRPCVLGKLTQGLLSALLAFLIWPIL